MDDLRPCVVFDLDDTLYDCTGQVKNKLVWKAARALCDEVPGHVDQVYQNMIRTRRDHPLENYFQLYLENRFNHNQLDDGRLLRLCKSAYSQFGDLLSKISLFEGGLEMLEDLRDQGWRMFIMTKGDRSTQNMKLDVLGIRSFFEGIYICSGGEGDSKLDVLRRIISVREISVDRLVIVGDRPDSELTAGLIAGARYLIHYVHGIYRNLSLGEGDRKIDFKVSDIKVLRSVLINQLYLELIRRWKVVCIGGGTGQPLLMNGLIKEIKDRRMRGMVDLVSVVAMTDSGRSSGKLRKLFGCPPPGDCRNCLASSVPVEFRGDLHRLFQYRFNGGQGEELEGHSLGNLMLVALWQMNGGDFGKAVSTMAGILDGGNGVENDNGIGSGDGVEGGMRCRVLPVCEGVVDLCAQLENGLAKSEVEVRRVGKSKINRVWVEYSDPNERKKLGVPKVSDSVISEIESADLVILGPGSFWTSVMCHLGYDGMVDALSRCNGKVIWVANLTTQPGQTDGMTCQEHLNKLIAVLGKRNLDGVVVNTGVPEKSVIERYQREGVNFIEHDSVDNNWDVITGDLLEDGDVEDRNLWKKQDCIRHDPSKLGNVIFDWMLKNL